VRGELADKIVANSYYFLRFNLSDKSKEEK